MQATKVEALERTIQKTNQWLKAIEEVLEIDDRRLAFLALRVTLHALRDRLPPEEAVQLGAQLPTLVRGVYYEGWRMVDTPNRIRQADEFLGVIAAEAHCPSLDCERAARAVFKLLSDRISPGEVRDVKSNLPTAIRQLWPE